MEFTGWRICGVFVLATFYLDSQKREGLGSQRNPRSAPLPNMVHVNRVFNMGKRQVMLSCYVFFQFDPKDINNH